MSLHNLGTVVDGQHHISDTSLGKSLNLVLDHGFVGELDEGLGKSEGLCHGASLVSFHCLYSSGRAKVVVMVVVVVIVQEVADGCRSHPRE